ncbi:hypothetical protein [Amycolatopsis sp. 195334CR]|uniref:hypothetical protein n=1 Tax=Amycolatopsis sp. 195334CR TaxID=2814588 RepID=UPI001A8EAD3D|nr:hypothetical protein [Amycolatopsis sp. 195334CR]MBN6037606.1 hypothetical protein [Amycolatopsis sp. 195334CR]
MHDEQANTEDTATAHGTSGDLGTDPVTPAEPARRGAAGVRASILAGLTLGAVAAASIAAEVTTVSAPGGGSL